MYANRAFPAGPPDIRERRHGNVKILLAATTPYRSDGVLLKQSRLWMPGLTLPMIAASTPENIELEVVNETIEDIDLNGEYDLVGLSAMGPGIIRAWDIADAFRSRDIPVIIGGIMASLAVKQCLEHCDSVLVGEAENIWPLIVKDAESGSLQHVYKADGLVDLDSLPIPRYDVFDQSKMGFWLPVQAGRGCPHHCAFCSISSHYGGRYRKRHIDYVANDLEAALSRGVRKILLLDDNVGADAEYAETLFRMIRKYKVQWMTQCSLTIARQPDLLKLAAESGCICMSFGLESLNQKNLDRLRKNFSRTAEYEQAIRSIRRAGIDVSTEMIFGLDEDNSEVFDQVADFLIRNRITIPRLHILTPIPGTELWDSMVAEDRLITRDWSLFTGGNVVFKPKNISADELQAGYWRAYEKVFSIPSILSRFFLKRRIRGFLIPLFLLGANFHYRDNIRHRICPGIV
jgi:radical SAM superfamily enzyme YgiQ (UPF0313 family)